MNREIALIKRLGAGAKPILNLDAGQLDALQVFRKKLSDADYFLAPNPCLCGGAEDHLIAERDRYGLAVRTVLCQVCGLMRTDPYLSQSSIASFYEQDYRALYNSKGISLDEFFANQKKHGFEIENFVRSAQVTNKKVFEVGCGAGGILDAFRTRGWQVAGCDFGKDYLTYGCNQGLDLVYGDATRLDQFGTADLVILCHVLEHFRDPVGELEKIRSLISDGGSLYVEVPGLFWIQNSYKNADLGRYLQNAHVYHFCLESLDYVMQCAGFTRLRGDERIYSLYAPSTTEPVVPKDLARRTIEFLKELEWVRRYETIKSALPLRTRKWLSRIKRVLVPGLNGKYGNT